ncbi:MAG: hypothetical protein R2752_12245 [Vicinamibacterales bacterium]
MMSTVRPWVGAALTVAFVVSIGARCLVGQDMTAAQMACCVGTDHECQSVGAEDCCVGSDAQQRPPADRLQSASSVKLVAVAGFTAIPPDLQPASERLMRTFDRPRVFVAAAPIHIVFCTLLI